MVFPTGSAASGGDFGLGIGPNAASEPSLSLLFLFGMYLLLRWVDREGPPTSSGLS